MNSIMRWDFILGSQATNRFLTNFGKNGFPDICSFKLILQGNISKLRTNACEREYSNIFLLARRGRQMAIKRAFVKSQGRWKKDGESENLDIKY